jgi:sensor histidine kinase YesM
MEKKPKHLIDNPALRILQHLLFWVTSFFIFLYIFKIGTRPVKIDYVYTALFQLTLLPPVYINLEILIPWLRRTNSWKVYGILFIILVAGFSWINMQYFADWSNIFLPDYFFISYFSFFQIAIIFLAYMAAASLIKLSKSWFIVNDLQKDLLMAQQQRSRYEKELLELEAKALRAQMNPHFIFNCLNSIKSLIQQHEEEKSVNYLTTFSKLIRNLFNNADKKEISLYDEIETCKLYLQLEAMRFDTRFSFAVTVDENIDLKSIQVPALIIQPFIENAIWHGIVPKGEAGHIELSVIKKANFIEIIIADNGIGREASKQNRMASGLVHQSKGVNLTESRLELDNLLRQREARLEVIDKKDLNGLSNGTSVVITINEEIA